MLRIINTALLLAAVCGALFALRAERTRRELAREHRRLAGKVGFLAIDDEHEVHVQALPTGDPLHFAWQIYFPANYTAQWRSVSFNGSSAAMSFWQDAHREIVRVRFRNNQGNWQLWMKHSSSGSLQSVAGPVVQMLEHPEHLRVEQFGVGGSKTVGVDQLVELVRISSDEANTNSGTDAPLLLVRFGTPQAWAKQGASTAR